MSSVHRIRESVSRSIGFRSVELFKEETIGAGSYGAVFRARCNGVECAAKMVHSALIEELSTLYGQGIVQILTKFQQECYLLSQLRHPNIVQYLGTHQDPESGLPILLMELMDESLTHFLENSSETVAYHTQVNFCRDIALALSFLHSNDIIHRDLSSNNVLLDNHSTRAKVTDFGMSKLGLNPQASYSTLTMCPGTVSYMPPEAVQDISVYSDKLDCFSFGVLVIQILTRKFPNPGDLFPASQSQHSNSSSNQFSHPVKLVPEIKRRWNHIREVEQSHPLLPIALNCLKDSESERPSASELYETLRALKENSLYSDSVYYDSLPQTLGQRSHSLPQIDVESRHTSQLIRQQDQQKDLPVNLCDHQRQQLSMLKETLDYTLNKIMVLRQVTERKKTLLNSSKQAIERSDKVIAKLKAQTTHEAYFESGVSQKSTFRSNNNNLLSNDGSIPSVRLNVLPKAVSFRQFVHDESDDTDHEPYSHRVSRPNHGRTPVHTKRPEKKSRLKRGVDKLEEHPLKKKEATSLDLHQGTQIDPRKSELSLLKELEYAAIKPSVGKAGYVAILCMPKALPTDTEEWDAVFAVYPRDVKCGHPFSSYLADLLGPKHRIASIYFQFSSTEIVLLEIQSVVPGYNIESNPEQFVVTKQAADTAVCDYTIYPPRCIITIIPTSGSPPRLNAQLTLHGAETKSFLRLKLPRISNSHKPDDRHEGQEKPPTTPIPKPRRKYTPLMRSVPEYDSMTASSSSYEDHDGGINDYHWATICSYLSKLDRHQIIRLGGELGLNVFKLENMHTLPDDMVRAWLRKQDDVKKKSGNYLTWMILVKALRRIGQEGIADKIKKKQKLF